MIYLLDISVISFYINKAASGQHIDIVRDILDQGFSLSEARIFHYTPLTISCVLGNIEILSLLLDSGYDPNIYESNNSPLEIARGFPRDEMVKLLIEYGALEPSYSSTNDISRANTIMNIREE